MKCQFCHKVLDKADLGASTCQGCGDVFDQTQVVELRDYLNIEAYKPPEITLPVDTENPLLPPESEQCVDCFADLMDDDLESWRNGSPCPYCGVSSTHLDRNSSRSISDMTNQNRHSLHKFIVNSGPLMGKEIMLSSGSELGRKQLRAALSDTGYEKLLSTISAEHFRLHALDNGMIGVEDLGSRNGTFLNGDRVVGPIPRQMEFGDVLNIHNLCLTPTPTSSPCVLFHHQQSGVSWKLPLTKTKQTIHLGRLTKTKSKTPWYRMAQLHLSEHVDKHSHLDSISRKHFFMDLVLDADNVKIQFWHEATKVPCEVQIGTITGEIESKQTSNVHTESIPMVVPLGKKITVKMPKNTFSILTVE